MPGMLLTSLFQNAWLKFSSKANEACVRLVLGENVDLGLDHRYIALSHCWGDPKRIPKTTRTNIALHQENITSNILSKTFQDAVKVTRELGIRFLWIDSLCILQDVPQDFEEECARMHLVYQQAYCTLSAHGL